MIALLLPIYVHIFVYDLAASSDVSISVQASTYTFTKLVLEQHWLSPSKNY